MYPRIRELLALLLSWSALGVVGCPLGGCMSDGGWQVEAGMVFKTSLNQIQAPTGNPSVVGFQDMPLPSLLEALGFVAKPEPATAPEPVVDDGG